MSLRQAIRNAMPTSSGQTISVRNVARYLLGGAHFILSERQQQESSLLQVLQMEGSYLNPLAIQVLWL